jgi:hypothetical protein
MASFEEEIRPWFRRRLGPIDEWFEEYAAGAFVGEELEGGPLRLTDSTRPTIDSVQDVGELEVTWVEGLGDRKLRVVCQAPLVLDLLRNYPDDPYDDCVDLAARLSLTIFVDTKARRITGHRVHRVEAESY